MNRAPKAWDGGMEPQLTPTDLAFVAHHENCPVCSSGPLSVCPEGLRLYDAVNAQFDGHSHDSRAESTVAATNTGAASPPEGQIP